MTVSGGRVVGRGLWAAAILPTVASAALAMSGLGSAKVAGLQLTAVAIGVFIVLGFWWIRRRPAQDRVAAAAVLCVTLMVILPISRLPGLTSVTLMLFLAAPLLWCAASLDARTPVRVPYGWAVLLLLAPLTVSTVLAPESGVLRLLLTISSVVPPLILGGLLSRPALAAVAGAVVSGVVVQALLGIVEPWLPEHLWGPAQLTSSGTVAVMANPFVPDLDRSYGLLGHPLPYSLVLVAAVGLALRVTSWTTRRRVLIVVVLCAGIAMSGSRNSMIMVMFMLLVFPASRPLTFGRGVAAVLIGSGVLLWVSSTGVLDPALDEFTASGSYYHRVAAYEAFGSLLGQLDIASGLIGNGVASLPRLFDQQLLQTDGFEVVDNQFVSVLAQAGLIGLIAFAALNLGAVQRAGFALRPGVIAVVASSFVFDWLTWPSTAALGALVMGSALSRVGRQNWRDSALSEGSGGGGRHSHPDDDPPELPVTRTKARSGRR